MIDSILRWFSIALIALEVLGRVIKAIVEALTPEPLKC